MSPEPAHLRRQREKEPEPEIRRALDPGTGQPIPREFKTSRDAKQFLEGKLTFIGLALTAAGAIGRMLGWDLPTDEVQSFLTWLLSSWDGIVQGIGIIIAAWGRLRINWRKA